MFMTCLWGLPCQCCHKPISEAARALGIFWSRTEDWIRRGGPSPALFLSLWTPDLLWSSVFLLNHFSIIGPEVLLFLPDTLESTPAPECCEKGAEVLSSITSPSCAGSLLHLAASWFAWPAGAGWSGVHFLHSSLYRAVFWICHLNSTDKCINVLALVELCLHSDEAFSPLSMPTTPPLSKLGVYKKLGGMQLGQLAWIGNRDIPWNMMCLAIKAMGKWGLLEWQHLPSQVTFMCGEALLSSQCLTISWLMESTGEVPFALLVHVALLHSLNCPYLHPWVSCCWWMLSCWLGSAPSHLAIKIACNQDALFIKMSFSSLLTCSSTDSHHLAEKWKKWPFINEKAFHW